MEANDYRDLMTAIQNLEIEVIETRHIYIYIYIRSLSVCLLVYILRTLGYTLGYFGAYLGR